MAGGSEVIPATYGAGTAPERTPAEMSKDPSKVTRSALSQSLYAMIKREGLSLTDPINGQSRTRLERVVSKLYDCAEAGESWAINAVLDRILGKATQHVEVEGDNVAVLVIRGGASMGEL